MACLSLVLRLAAIVALASAPIAAQVPSSTPPTPARDAAPGATGHGVIRGRVTSGATGQPLHRVRLTLNGLLANPPVAVTDARGRFEFTALPAGTYTLTAARAGYLSCQYGQRRPHEVGRSITLDDDQAIEEVEMALARGAVLAGRVTDDMGEPLSGARVEAVELRYIRGRRVAVAARIVTTTDEGEYRLGGLEAGSYQVRASSNALWEGDEGRATFTFAVTYFPGVAAADRPQGIRVASGQQVTGLDFRMLVGRAARIAGTVQSANGDPIAGQVVYASRITRGVGGRLESSGPGPITRTDDRGAFDFPKLAAGEWLIITGGPNDTTTKSVVIDDSQSTTVAIAPRRSSSVVGTVVSDDGARLPFATAGLEVVPVPADAAKVLPAWGDARETSVQADGAFRLRNLDGEYLFRVNGLRGEWMLKAVTLAGRDITDRPLNVMAGGGDVEGMRVVVGRKGALVEGEVSDAAGTPAPDATVVVFAADASRWGVASRFVRAVRPDRRGRFSVPGLPPGDYRVAARDDVAEGQWEDPGFLEGLLKDTMKLQLVEGASESVKLTLEPAR